MAIVKAPKKPLPRNYRPKDSKPWKVSDGDSWWSLARMLGIDVWDLIRFNFQTSDPAEVNWYLQRNVGCRKHAQDGKNYSFSSADSPGIVYLPLSFIDCDDDIVRGDPLPPPAPPAPIKYEKLGFWFEGLQGNVPFYKRVMGNLAFRFNRSYHDWYAFELTASFASLSVPIKGNPGINWGDFKTTEDEYTCNRELFDPRRDWKTAKRVYVRLAGDRMWIRIVDAFPQTPNEAYKPLREARSRDLNLEFRPDGVELGWATGTGFIRNCRKVTNNNKGDIIWA